MRRSSTSATLVRSMHFVTQGYLVASRVLVEGRHNPVLDRRNAEFATVFGKNRGVDLVQPADKIPWPRPQCYLLPSGLVGPCPCRTVVLFQRRELSPFLGPHLTCDLRPEGGSVEGISPGEAPTNGKCSISCRPRGEGRDRSEAVAWTLVRFTPLVRLDQISGHSTISRAPV